MMLSTPMAGVMPPISTKDFPTDLITVHGLPLHPALGMNCSGRRMNPTNIANCWWIVSINCSTGDFQSARLGRSCVHQSGHHFSVYADRRGVEKIFPFDLIPRPVASSEWKVLEAGLVQRIRALNMFLDDIYHDRRILKEGVVPEDLVLKSKGYRPEMVGFSPPGKQYIHVVRHGPHPRWSRPISGPRRQWPNAFGRQLRARKSGRDEEGLPARFSTPAGCGASKTIRNGCARLCVPVASRTPAISRAWCAVARPLQLGLFRA